MNRKKIILPLILAVFVQAFPVFAEPVNQQAEGTASVVSETAPTATPAVPEPAETPEATSAPEQTPIVIEPTPEPTPEPGGLKAHQILLDVYIAGVPNLNWSDSVFGIYNEAKEYLGEQTLSITQTGVTHTLIFDVPEYYTGAKFYIMPISGLKTVQYCDTVYPLGAYIELATYAYLPTSAEDTGIGNHFGVTVTPLFDRPINLYFDGVYQPMTYRIKIQNDYCIVPMYEFMGKLGVPAENIKYDAVTGRIQIDYNGKTVIFFVGLTDAYDNYNFTYAETPTCILDDVIFIPLRFAVTALGCGVSANENGDALDVRVTLPYGNAAASFINSTGVSSRTNYLVWISRKDYTVTVFEGSANNWSYVNAFKCSIGAPSTPTITGQYEYFSREARWSYPTYYVGPIMRFYRGYAIHSTLLRYGGGVADGRLGMQISHGCVRVAPENMNWLVNTVPLYSKIYVT